ncbi:uncharacterized protein LOC100846316 [Brachypodium distachyon]|uniref:Uncharacterized protein n=1 Tax=Brachypodium distachyon TaxID=15368 RepID=I1IEN3_BRADI|nr:uncharacterized protein LOC100846316 [Brachypodium distachyon]KQK01661.1 hypothetical protein BRADI_3g57400v3 [Brachypodium distachyon]|eukprot:XP_003573023.1 uncharacterized protein LOC100846316 [Brachypodium distachyon]
MSSGGYYYGGDHRQLGAPSSYGNGYPRHPAASSSSSSSFYLCLFLATASLLGAASLYSRCESAMEGLLDQLRVALVLSPLLLLLAAQYWPYRRPSPSSASLLVAAPPPMVAVEEEQPWSYEQQQRRRGQDGGGAPWGVALALALVLMLVSYQPCFQDLWFPLGGRRHRHHR